MDYEKRVQEAVRELVRDHTVESAHDLSDGGLAVALAESAFGPESIGADLRLDSALAPELLLFHEGPSRILVSTANPQKVFEVARNKKVQAIEIGVTLEARLIIRNRGQFLIDTAIDELKDIWTNALEHLLHNPVLVPNS
jgi:phosphoribosylformylglycinamidine synthase